MRESGADSINELYNRFYQTIGRPKSDDTYFDEDDIIEIYDKANDLNDDLVKMEALFYGARMFPQSEALRVRREYLYYYLNNDKAVGLMLERRTVPTTLSRLLALRSRSDRGEATYAELEKILGGTETFDDEEVIQFISEASTPENYQWLKSNLDKIRQRCTYLPTFLYEMANVAEEKQDFPTAIAMAEELTMLEPFNIEFWQLLAEIQMGMQEFEDALISVDYALAIDPDAVRPKILKASILYRLHRRFEEVAELLKSVMSTDQFDDESLQVLTLSLMALGREQEASQIADEYLAKHPESIDALNFILAVGTDDIDSRLNAFAQTDAARSMTSDQWMQWAQFVVSTRRYEIALAILERARELNALPYAGEQFALELLYKTKEFEKVIQSVENAGQPTPAQAVLKVLSLVRIGRKEEALKYAVDYFHSLNSSLCSLPVQNEFVSESTRMFYSIGIQAILRNFIAALSSPDEIPVDDYDPYIPFDASI